MNEAELSSILDDIEGELDHAVETAGDRDLGFSTDFDESDVEVFGGPEVTAKAMRIFLSTSRKKKIKKWWKDLRKRLVDLIRETICCKGLKLVDTPEERKKLVELIYAALLKAAPTYIKAAIGVLKGPIKKAIEAVLKYLVGLAENLCKDVVCPIAPLDIDMTALES